MILVLVTTGYVVGVVSHALLLWNAIYCSM